MQGDPRLGTELAGHRIEAVIGRGRLAVVYLAHHLRLGRRVALKVLDPALAEDDAFRGTFMRESRLAAGLDHPNIVTVYDAGEDDGVLYVAMRYVDGTDLERLLESEGSLSPPRTVAIVAQVAEALDAAHSEGLVHRGVRPADILLEVADDGDRAFLSDFGITKHVAASTRLTRTGSFAGTVDYVAPEQIKGGVEADRRADVYSLGCVLYRCLVGEAPFARESELVTIYAHLEDPPPRPTDRDPGLPPAIDDVVRRALAKRPEDRFATASELANAAASAIGSTPDTTVAAPDRTGPARFPQADAGCAAWSSPGIAAVAILVAAGAILAADRDPGSPPSSPFEPGEAAVPGRSGDVVIAAAGEIACNAVPYVEEDLDHCRYDDTSDLIRPGELSAVFALGDTQYDEGTLDEYLAFYDPWWGRAKSITQPVPGDREYANDPTSEPSGYFEYFGEHVRGPNGFGYYSLDLPSGCTPDEEVCWHVIALNSELCLLPDGCGPPGDGPTSPGNDMYAWLEQDLAAHPNDRYGCTVAYWHHPLVSHSLGISETPGVRPLWDLLYAARADVVLNANSHNYQRWDPLDPTGQPDPRGLRQFVVGTGGSRKDQLDLAAWPPGLAAAQDTSFGILLMELQPSTFTWEWVSADGQPAFADAASTPTECR